MPPFVKVASGPFVNDAGQIELTARIWKTKGEFDAGDPPWGQERFLFARAAAVTSRIVADPVDDWPLLDDGTRAPAYTLSEARQQALDDNPTLGVLQALVSASGDATAQTRWTALVDLMKDRYLGEAYLPAGKDWKREPVATLDVAEIKDAIRRYIVRTLAAEGVGDDLLANDAAIGALAGTEFSV